jgi:hypothetical protein
MTLPENVKTLQQYHDVLLYCHAYPCDQQVLKLVSAELKRFTETLQRQHVPSESLTNTGLPFTDTIATFSHALLRWMALNRDYEISIDSFGDDAIPLNDVLQLTLPEIEKQLTSAGYTNDELFDALSVESEDRLRFLLSEFQKLESVHTRDYIFDKLRIYIRITPKNAFFSKSFNRLKSVKPYYHSELLKHFDDKALINSPLPSPSEIDPTHLTKVIRHSLILLQRETDPDTHLDTRSLRLYELERGMSIALYTMTPERQLPFESYVGYTLFKNGYPAAYGGAWVFGRYALFGINIFDAFRGGESGFMLCQLLRTYRQVFHVSYIEVEPYQFGKENPEGIETGAYWFYYHYGFRSVEPRLRALAEKEQKKFRARLGYRTSPRTLRLFTESNTALNLGKSIPPSVFDFTVKITGMIANRYGGDRISAVEDSVRRFKTHSHEGSTSNTHQESAFIDMSLLHNALHIRAKVKSRLLFEMAKMKSVDVYGYQELLLNFLRGY